MKRENQEYDYLQELDYYLDRKNIKKKKEEKNSNQTLSAVSENAEYRQKGDQEDEEGDDERIRRKSE